MRIGKIHLYWLLIAVPTLVLGAAAVRLLHGEQARLRAMALRADDARVERLAETVRCMVAAIELDVMRQLEAIPLTGDEAALRDWVRTDPRIRNVFIWSPESGVRYPTLRGATEEERRFLARYAPLFQGEVPWTQTDEASDAGLAARRQASPEQQAKREISQLRADSGRAAATATADVVSAAAGDWRTWFEGNQIHLLGWQRLPDGVIRGVELETVTILSRLPAVFESVREPDQCYDLQNGEGSVLVRAGEEPAERRPPDVRVSLAPELPHWEIVFYRLAGGVGGAHTTLLPAWLLLASVLASLAAGGILLMRDAAAQRRDALQKTNFVSGVSHELKTPLTSIRLYAELLRDGRVADERKRTGYLGVIVTESERLTRLVNNVLDFSRMEQGRRRYALERLDLRQLLREGIDAQRGRIETAGMELVFEADEVAVVLPVDRDAVGQILVNLLDNAVKYARDGGEVTVTLRAVDGGVTVTVQDRGPGIATAHRVHLFESFYRADCELTAKCTGCGLGLSIARRLMRGMGGDLSFAPRAGGGSCFTLHFAAREAMERCV